METFVAELYSANPGYLQLQAIQANANALQQVDKIIFTQEGVVPTLVLPGPGIMPTLDTGAAANLNAPVVQPKRQAQALEKFNESRVVQERGFQSALLDPNYLLTHRHFLPHLEKF
jgi:hypothetical protein